MYTLSKASEEKLIGVHPDLVRVVRRAIEITEIDFKVGEGVRTIERQRKLVAEGKSKTLNSRHIPGRDGLGKAVDLWAMPDGRVSWEQRHYVEMAKHVLTAAQELGIAIRWGGDWDQDGDWRDERFFDGPHFELDRRAYPA